MTQTEQVVEKMRELGGCSTFGKLNGMLNFSEWKTKTPEASVRRIVQESPEFFKIKPGLWALSESRDEILRKFEITLKNDTENDGAFSHTYFQGLVVEIGNMKGLATSVPCQDKNRKFLDKPLKDVISLGELYRFANDRIQKRAATVDVIWFNEREMPSAFFEIEHTTDIQNSLSKYYELQDFYATLAIVADHSRQRLFEDILSRNIYASIKCRVRFVNYEQLVTQYEAMCRIQKSTII